MGKWRRRFPARRLDGLLDEPRPGGPRTISDAEAERVVTLTLETSPPLTLHTGARAPWLSQSAISRIWRAFALQASSH